MQYGNIKSIKEVPRQGQQGENLPIGETLSTSDLDRVNNLVSRGICSISAIKEANKEEKKPEKISLFDKEFEIGAVKGALAEIGVSINKNAGVQAITNKLGELTEEQNKALSEILCKE